MAMNQNAESELHALVVDDEVEVVELIRIVLQEAGYLVDGAHDGIEALQLFPKRKWSIVITDRVMPRMSGDDLRVAIRTRDSETPLLLVTGQFRGSRDESQWDAVLPKPFSCAGLREAVRKARDRSRYSTV
jgi:DNA-binding response OmpR family regulator